MSQNIIKAIISSAKAGENKSEDPPSRSNRSDGKSSRDRNKSKSKFNGRPKGKPMKKKKKSISPTPHRGGEVKASVDNGSSGGVKAPVIVVPPEEDRPDVQNSLQAFESSFEECSNHVNEMASVLRLIPVKDEEGNVLRNKQGQPIFKLRNSTDFFRKKQKRPPRDPELTSEEERMIRFLRLRISHSSLKYVKILKKFVESWLSAMGATECKDAVIVSSHEEKVVACVHCNNIQGRVEYGNLNFVHKISIGKDKPYIPLDNEKYTISSASIWEFPLGKDDGECYTIFVGNELVSMGKGKCSELGLVPMSKPPSMKKQGMGPEYEHQLTEHMMNPNVLIDQLQEKKKKLDKYYTKLCERKQGAQHVNEATDVRTDSIHVHNQIKCLKAYCLLQEAIMLEKVSRCEDSSPEHRSAVNGYQKLMKRRKKSPDKRGDEIVDDWRKVESVLNETEMAGQNIQKYSAQLGKALACITSCGGPNELIDTEEEKTASVVDRVQQEQQIKESLFCSKPSHKGVKKPVSIRFAYTCPDNAFDPESGEMSSYATFDTLFVWVHYLLQKVVVRITTQWKIKVSHRSNGMPYDINKRTPYKLAWLYELIEEAMSVESFHRLVRNFPIGKGTFDIRDRLWLETCTPRCEDRRFWKHQMTFHQKCVYDKNVKAKKVTDIIARKRADAKRGNALHTKRVEAKERKKKEKIDDWKTMYDFKFDDTKCITELLWRMAKKFPHGFFFNGVKSNVQIIHRLFVSNLSSNDEKKIQVLMETCSELLMMDTFKEESDEESDEECDCGPIQGV